MIKATVKSKTESRARDKRKTIVLTIIVLSLLLILSMLSGPWQVSEAVSTEQNSAVIAQPSSDEAEALIYEDSGPRGAGTAAVFSRRAIDNY